jgi:hypothetical protein
MKRWDRLLAGYPWHRGAGAYPIAAYSEFLPPPRLGLLPYGTLRLGLAPPPDLASWPVTEHEEAFELVPGLEHVAEQVVSRVARLGRGEANHGVSPQVLEDNPYWPARLAGRAGRLPWERYVSLLSLALSRTQDDKGRVRWTLLGGSDLGPARPFWCGLSSSRSRKKPAQDDSEFLRRLLVTAYGLTPKRARDLHRAGLRILPQGKLPAPLPDLSEGPLPGWTGGLLWEEGQSLVGVRFLLTFRPFAVLPEPVQAAYLAGKLHLLPFPGSLAFWGAPLFLKLRQELPAAMQIALLWHVAHHDDPNGFRVPQSGWMHEPGPEGSPAPPPGPGEMLRNTYRRSHRHMRILRDQPPEVAVSAREDRVAHVLFDSSESIGLYGKPMARNAQVWTRDGRLLLDGPRATPEAIEHAACVVAAGGMFGYRFVFPAMVVGTHEVVWHRPVAACLPEGTARPAVLPGAPPGLVTAMPVEGDGSKTRAVELRPHLLAREPFEWAATLFTRTKDPRPRQTARNCRRLLEARAVFEGRPLPRGFARRLLTAPQHQTLEAWLDSLPARSDDPALATRLVDELRRGLEPESAAEPAHEPITYSRTARRAFEVGFWRSIEALSTGRFPNRNNADCVRDAVTRRALVHPGRDLPPLGDYLRARHTRAIAAAGMSGRAQVGDLPFHWRTDSPFRWSDGWLANQGAEPQERDLIVIIPGRDRSRAVILADHYDTAYMADVFREDTTRDGPRLAAPGSDDNSSATATLLMAAPGLLALSRAGRLARDVWLVHLTGEEFPADCLGARNLVQRLVERTLAVRLANGRRRDLSGVRVAGVYLLDMVAHDNPRRRGTFQIAPGDHAESWQLALLAHRAAEAWNAAVPGWNRHPARRRPPVRPDRDAARVPLPPIARHPLVLGEVRPHDDPRSTLYNTDGQIFSDAGIPVVLLMEDYDIDRSGYHDSHDTMAGIDLDYGAALAAIAIESVALAAGA